MTTQDKQIQELNTRVKVRIAPSKIHGVGVFAIRDIPEGTKIYGDHMPTLYNVPYSSFDKLFPEVKALLLERWPAVVAGSRFAYPDTRLQAYINHGGDNSNYDAPHDVTTRDITAGEEILEDYRVILGWEKVFPWIETKKKKKKEDVV